MFLTRLRLDPRSAAARRDLADPYQMHRTLTRAFVDDDGATPPRILWRLEPQVSWSEPIVLVQSEQSGRWEALAQLPGYLKSHVEARQFDPAELIGSSEQFRFRLFANPTVTRDRKRLGLLTEPQQLDWLKRQGERLGFSVQTALVTQSDMLKGRKGNMQISLLRVGFEGYLRVLDGTPLSAAIRNGIGPGKAFGCGLLSLART